MATENYWKKKYADVHPRLTSRIAELEKENAELKEALKTLAEGLNMRQQILQGIKDFLEVPEFYLYDKETIHDRILQKITKEKIKGANQ